MNIPLGFLIKKALGMAVMPLSICLLFFAAGCFYIFLRRFKDSIAPFAIGAMLLYAFSLTSVSAFLVRPLEQLYAPLDMTASSFNASQVKWVVVLGSGHWTDERLPAGAMLYDTALHRLVEGLRVANVCPNSVLVVSGGKYRDEQSAAAVMARAAVELGFDPTRIVLSDQSLDTDDEAGHIASMVGQEPCVLVTSATHMFRAMKLFQSRGLRPIPAPTDFRSRGEPEDFLPYPGNIDSCHIAVHEYLGLVWSFLRGQIALDAS